MTTIILKAWLLWRMRKPEQFLSAKSCRRLVWLRELEALRADLRALQQPLTEKALELLTQWAPESWTPG